MQIYSLLHLVIDQKTSKPDFNGNKMVPWTYRGFPMSSATNPAIKAHEDNFVYTNKGMNGA